MFATGIATAAVVPANTGMTCEAILWAQPIREGLDNSYEAISTSELNRIVIISVS